MDARGRRRYGAVAGRELRGVKMDIVGGDWLSTDEVVSPDVLIEAIDGAATIEDLVAIRPQADRILEKRLAEGRSAKRMTRLVTDFNDRITLKLLKIILDRILEQGGGRPPSPFTWISLGSEGRLEQALRTDQDNALAYQDVPASREQETQKWFLNLSKQMVDGLVRCGFPPCPGDIMASNPAYCQSESAWRSLFMGWVRDPNPHTLRMISIFFDFRPIYQERNFLAELREEIDQAIKETPHFLRFMAKNSLENVPPLSMFRQLVVEKSGEHKGKINIKMRGLTPVVDAARIMALDFNIRATNTLERLEAEPVRKVLGSRFINDLREAYSFLTLVKIALHLDARAEGRVPDNYLNPDELSNFRRMMLKESFALINRLQDTMKFRYQTQFVLEV